MRMHREIRYLPTLPTGAGDWFDRHKGAVVGGSVGLLALGPVGALAGIGLGEDFHDQEHRAQTKV